ncbi:putative bifunctional diguanylate cyclase/phosphodiesterase [Deinococcus ruber]|uniref:putative bifunctional diguanylate cyclase/phosphodiesterase n=1 Tax=Deinococcus ruber TaxID=1848197 RepID=UPI00166B862F|nr:EAL domain-containing protein [Deinococcus ruber]
MTLSLTEMLATLDLHNRQIVQRAIQTAETSAGLVEFSFQSVNRSGERRSYVGTCASELGEQGVRQRILGTLQNVTARREAESSLMASESKLRAVIDHTQDAITIKDRQGRFLLVNPPAARAMGSSADQLLQQSVDFSAFDADALQRIRMIDAQVMQHGQSVSYELDWRVAGTEVNASVTAFPFWQDGAIQGTICIAHDVTRQKLLERELRDSTVRLEQRVLERTRELERFTAQLQHSTLHDELTGLPNRVLLMNRLNDAVSRRLEDDAATFVVLFLDFDRFKLINDSLGHNVGDELLKQIATRLQATIEAGDTVARLGGDEFVVLACHVQTEQDATQYATRLIDQFADPFMLADHELRITASIGMTACDHRYATANDAVRDADIAMYRAKAQRRGNYVIFEPAMRERQVLLLGLQSELGQALRRSELRVHYQPVVTKGGLRISGVEALIRWQHPVHGLIPPADFIVLAEERGLVCELDLWVLREACTELMRLSGPPLGLGVNFSARHFEQPIMYEQVRKILDDTGYPAHKLILEITERLLLTNSVLVLSLLKQFQEGGMQVAIDDFGTGYSSLRYLQQLPMNIIKIDRSFSAGVVEKPEVVRSIVELAHTLNMTVVAEGVETFAQVQALTALGCDYLQGFLFSTPLSFPELQSWLETFQSGRPLRGEGSDG